MQSYFRKEGRKGQFTAFVILGIVLLVVVVITLAIMSMIVTNDLELQGRNAVKDYLDQKSINYYVYTCIDAAVQDVLEKYALQGGVIFDYQGGEYVSDRLTEGAAFMPFNYTFNSTAVNFNLTYGITSNGLCPSVQMEPPEYPFDKTRFDEINLRYESEQGCSRQFYGRSGALGLNNYTRLCYPGSPNSELKQNVFSQCINNVVMTPNRSVEMILQLEIAKRIEKCIDFSYFELTANHNITVSGPPNTTIVFNDDTFAVRLDYPFSVKLKGREPILVRHVFDYSSNLRLTKLSKYMVNLLEKETEDIYFDMGRDFMIVPGFDPGTMKLSIYNITSCVEGEHKYMKCRYENDSVIILQDKRSKIGNHSLTFMSAVKNRRPVLDYIHETNPSQFFDIIVAENGVIKIEPLGKDPDDKPVTYNYLGWKETFDEEFLCDFPLVPPKTIESCITVRDESLFIIDHNWTTSKEFKDTGRIATYKTNRTDIGPHNVTVQVVDVSGLVDYQILRILVFDMPHIEITPPQIFSDIDKGNVSIEDPYTIDAGGTTPSQFGGSSTITDYTWEDTWHPSMPEREFIKSTGIIPKINVPFDIDPLFTIQNIHTIPVRRPAHTDDPSDYSHNMKLIVDQYVPLYGGTGASEESIPLDVHQCVMHENSLDPYPYPYNNDPTNPFIANHACCLGTQALPSTYHLAGALTPTTCAEQIVYGELKYLSLTEPLDFSREDGSVTYGDMLQEYRTLVDKPNPFITTNALSFSAPSQKNDVYKIELTRLCDGVRGNLCAGPISGTLIVEDQCLPDKSGTEDETCSGPSSQRSDNPGVIQCISYGPGNSFEKTFEPSLTGDGANGICNEHSVPSRLGNGGYGQATYFDALGVSKNTRLKCKATCSSTGCTNTEAEDCECNAALPPEPLGCKGQSPPSWIGNECKYFCMDPQLPSRAVTDENACKYGKSITLPCTKVGTGGQTQCVTTNTAYSVGYCYYNVNCLPSSASFEKGERCQSGQIDTVTVGAVTTEYCVYGAPLNTYGTSCTNEVCNGLSRTKKPTGTCSDPSGWRCTADSGWRCGIPAP